MDSSWEGFWLGVLTATFIVGFFVLIFTKIVDNDYWETESVARGYAHYELDHSFHWNNERK